MKKKTVAMLLALVLVIGCTVGGTIAWLTAQTDAVTNTFTVGNINIKLAEGTGDTYKMVPGSTITKDPKVTVDKNSEACYLFVKVTESDNLKNFIDYTVDNAWTKLADVPGAQDADGVYYREVTAETAKTGAEYYVLASNQVTVLDSVTKEAMDALSQPDATQPTLTFTAYACQKDNVDSVVDAWKQVNAK